jgi:hypothetical protein
MIDRVLSADSQFTVSKVLTTNSIVKHLLEFLGILAGLNGFHKCAVVEVKASTLATDLC